MTLRSTLEQEIRDLIRAAGRITFARFMRACLYSPRGGFYASGSEPIGAHYGTSAMSHPAFGALVARQLEQMWHLLGSPGVFHVIEVGCGDGSLARSVNAACSRMTAGFARALNYVAADCAPRSGQPSGTRASAFPDSPMQHVKTDGLRAFRNVVGCILSNELIDNFPVHRFAIQGGKLKEVFVTLADDEFTEVLDEPSSPRIEERLASLGLSLPDGYRGEVNLGLDDWIRQIGSALERGFVLTIDYGSQASALYSPANKHGTLVCYHRHAVLSDPYRNVGRQDITCQVDFTTLARLSEAQGLATVGYSPQRRFLANLGFDAMLDALETQDLSDARKTLSRIAMMSLVDPEQFGDLKVLAQAKGVGSALELEGFSRAARVPASRRARASPQARPP